MTIECIMLTLLSEESEYFFWSKSICPREVLKVLISRGSKTVYIIFNKIF